MFRPPLPRPCPEALRTPGDPGDAGGPIAYGVAGLCLRHGATRRTLAAAVLAASAAALAWPAWADRDGRDDRREVRRDERVRDAERDPERDRERDRERDHERARAAVQAGEVMPLPRLMARLQATHPGQVLGLELEREDGRWIYELRLLQDDGQLLKLDVDARTGEVLKVRRRGQAGPGRPPTPAPASTP